MVEGASDLVKSNKKVKEAAKAGSKNFDQAREEAFKKAGMDKGDVEFSKIDEKTGTIVEFKGKKGAKVAYDGPHSSPGANHEVQHVGYQKSGKRKQGGTERGNIPYDGPQHPSRSNKKD